MPLPHNYAMKIAVDIWLTSYAAYLSRLYRAAFKNVQDIMPFNYRYAHTSSNDHLLARVAHGVMSAQITNVSIVYLSVCSGGDRWKHLNSESLAFVWGIHRWPENSPHKGPVTWKMFPFDDVIICRHMGNVLEHGICNITSHCRHAGMRIFPQCRPLVPAIDRNLLGALKSH